MSKFFKGITLFALLGTITFMTSCESSTSDASSGIDAQVEALLAKMTLEEKVGQTNLYNGFWEATGPVPADGDAKQKYDDLANGRVGAVLNVKGVENVRSLQKVVVEESRLGIPLIFGYDVIHGQKTLAPIPLAESASWDLEAIKKSARMAAREASAIGINWTFAPMVDIGRDARWGRVMEGAGEDPYLGAKIATARVQGFQGDDLTASNTIAACTKHFAGYGFSEAGRDYNTVDIGTSTLYNVVFPPFKATVDADVKTFMNSFNTLNGVPATADAFLMRDILKEGWDFDGFVVSDWGSGKEMIDHGFARDLKHVAELSMNAGSDMDMESTAYVKHLLGLVESGAVKESVIDDAARRILKVKYELGLFDDPYRYCSEEREESEVYSAEQQAAALDMAKKSIVLLKNETQLLPLAKDQKKIAVIGALADDKTSPLGSWRIGSDDSTAISVLEGLSKHTSNFKYAKGADVITESAAFIRNVKLNETDKSGFKEAVNLARQSDVVLLVIGEHGYQSGEGRSRAKLDIPGVQQELMEEVYKANKNVILILMNGRPLAIPWAAENIPTILECWQLGSQTGNAIAEVVFGDYNPSGKLTMSFPRSVGQLPIYYNHFSTGRPGPIDLVFWSHYNDESNDPLFPFGYGLSYTTFEYSPLNIDTSDIKNIKVGVTVTNTGNLAGEEITQLYIRDRIGSTVRPVKELKGFEKYSLAPGASKTLSFTLTDKELGFFDSRGNFIVEPGTFDVMVGPHSQEGPKGTFELR